MPLDETSISLRVAGRLSKVLDLKSVQAALDFVRGISLANGTADGQADKLWDDTRTIVASGTDDIDLAGTLLDAFGDALTFAKVKMIAVFADPGNTNNVVLGNHPTAAFVGPFGAAVHTIAVPPGGLELIARPNTGWTVTPTSADMLRVTNSGGGSQVKYDIVIIGTSA